MHLHVAGLSPSPTPLLYGIPIMDRGAPCYSPRLCRKLQNWPYHVLSTANHLYPLADS